MANQADQIVLKSIKQLIDYNFFIPAYQRGYRWTENQVVQLLDDIWEFTKKDKKEKGEFYCLQPIVTKKVKDKLEVIDGQQRLTTIFIILKYLEDICTMLDSSFKLYSIEYATRKDSADFLDKIKTDREKYDNSIDLFFMKETFNTVEEWFNKKGNNVNKLKFVNSLIEQEIETIDEVSTDNANNVRVIWYEIQETPNNNSIDIFTRLNIGKIPLTNAELIKALFLQKSNFSEGQVSLKQLQIASEWDMIEKSLQDNSFWFFIYNPSNHFKYDNRIEYIFDLMKERSKESEFYFTFNEFHKEFTTHQKNNKPDIDTIWYNIKKYFLTLDEWFKDYELFHYIGYLIDCGLSINSIKKESENKPKNDFKEIYLVKEIRKQVNCDIDSISYGDKFVKKILLLFNIQTVLKTQKSDMRFPFHRYKEEDWDIEHICSQTDKTINPNNRKAWVDDMLEFFVGNDDIRSAEEYLKNLTEKNNDARNEVIESICKSLIEMKKGDKIDNDTFENCFESIRKYFKENNQKDDRDDISNLTLLDATTNRSYGNSFFPIKRKRIIMNDSNGIFIPIATKNLFLKYYSTQMNDIMYWNNEDATDYLNAIKTTLSIFLPKNK